MIEGSNSWLAAMYWLANVVLAIVMLIASLSKLGLSLFISTITLALVIVLIYMMTHPRTK